MRTDEITFRVRYGECDPMNVAHHTAYPAHSFRESHGERGAMALDLA